MSSPVQFAPLQSERLSNHFNILPQLTEKNNLHQFLPPNQENIPNNPHLLKEKQIEDILKNPFAETRESINPAHVPSRYSHKKVNTKMHLNTVVKLQNACQSNIQQDRRNVYYRYQSAHFRLLSAEIHRTCINDPSKTPAIREKSKKNEEGFIGLAKNEGQEAKTIDSLHPLSYYIDCLILEYKGVDCTDMIQVEEYVRLLKTCLALDPNAVDIKQNLEETIKFLKGRWQALKEEGAIDSATHIAWQQMLGSILKSNPLKHLFRNKPELFNLARLTTHTEFFTKHPELKSKQAFATKYPEYAQELGVELPKPTSSNISAPSLSLKPSSEKENIPSSRLTPINLKDVNEHHLTTEEANQVADWYVRALEVYKQKMAEVN